jgi:hypothetical protein
MLQLLAAKDKAEHMLDDLGEIILWAVRESAIASWKK